MTIFHPILKILVKAESHSRHTYSVWVIRHCMRSTTMRSPHIIIAEWQSVRSWEVVVGRIGRMRMQVSVSQEAAIIRKVYLVLKTITAWRFEVLSLAEQVLLLHHLSLNSGNLKRLRLKAFTVLTGETSLTRDVIDEINWGSLRVLIESFVKLLLRVRDGLWTQVLAKQSTDLWLMTLTLSKSNHWWTETPVQSIARVFSWNKC